MWCAPTTPYGMLALWPDWRITMVPVENNIRNNDPNRTLENTQFKTAVIYYQKEDRAMPIAPFLPNPPRTFPTNRYYVEILTRLKVHCPKEVERLSHDPRATKFVINNEVVKKYRFPATTNQKKYRKDVAVRAQVRQRQQMIEDNRQKIQDQYVQADRAFQQTASYIIG